MYKEELLMHSLSKFFSVKKNIDKMLPIINQKSKISLRILDWFTTNYSKKYKVIYKIQKDVSKGGSESINVHLNYKAQLKSYSKKQFDPFCRCDRIKFIYNKNDDFIETTVGQLCFFRWCIQNDILNYVQNNYNLIEQDMTTSLKKNKTNETPKKRQQLSFNASKSYTKTYEKIIISFD